MISIGPRLRRLPRALLLGLALIALAGCGTRTHPVEGKVLWQDGSPATELAGGVVVFESKDSPSSARGELQADGSFRLTTHKPGDGAFPGRYRVLITEALPQDSDRVPPPKMDRKFQAFETSGLEFTVEPSKNEPVFKVDRATPQQRRIGPGPAR
ncbi:MAG: hypothetical protein L0Z62_37860 [Gemmataceae bacterium]|nr:hypothetical protein [Gemmataceae bacterium]